MIVLGIDPGVTTGVALWWDGEWEAGQLSDGLVEDFVSRWCAEGATFSYEKFVVRRRAGITATSKANDTTQAVIGQVTSLAHRYNLPVYARSASEVKPWATDERLKAAGALEVCKGMGHARDAARHALFTAVKLGMTKDPLSTRN